MRFLRLPASGSISLGGASAREHFRKQWSLERAIFRRYRRFFFLTLVFQYLHVIAVRVASFLAIPREPLWDAGFALLPDPSPQHLRRLSTGLLVFLVIATLLFILSPLWINYAQTALRRRLFSTVILVRTTAVCIVAQTLRIVSFLATTLPGPGYDCRPDSPAYRPTARLLQIIAPPFFGGSTYGAPSNHCVNDLAFSNRALVVLLCALVWTHYAWPWAPSPGTPQSPSGGDHPASATGTAPRAQQRLRSSSGPLARLFRGCRIVAAWNRFHYSVIVVWLLAGSVCLFLVLSRQHYTLDVFIASYTVPLVWIAFTAFMQDVVPTSASGKFVLPLQDSLGPDGGGLHRNPSQTALHDISELGRA